MILKSHPCDFHLKVNHKSFNDVHYHFLPPQEPSNRVQRVGILFMITTSEGKVSIFAKISVYFESTFLSILILKVHLPALIMAQLIIESAALPAPAFICSPGELSLKLVAAEEGLEGLILVRSISPNPFQLNNRNICECQFQFRQ